MSQTSQTSQKSHLGYKIAGNCLVVLRISKTAVTNESRSVSHKKTAKYRCNEARVESITHLKTGKHLQKVSSNHDHHFKYRIGLTVKVYNYDEDIDNICGSGIHYFITPVGAYVYWRKEYGMKDDGTIGNYDMHNQAMKDSKRTFQKRLIRLLTKIK